MFSNQRQMTKQAFASRSRTAPKVRRKPTRDMAVDALQRAQAEPTSITPADVRTLQRSIGNQATSRLLSPARRASHSQPTIQRSPTKKEEMQTSPLQGVESGAQVDGLGLDARIQRYREEATTGTRVDTINRSFKSRSFTPVKGVRPNHIQREGDDERPGWQQANRTGGTERGGFRLGGNRQTTGGPTTGGNQQWQGGTTTGGRGGLTIGGNRWQKTNTPTRGRGGFAMGSRSEENQKAILIRKIRDTYGINIDQTAGVNAVRNAYPNAPEAVRNGVRARDWTLRELQDVDMALSHYARLLGPSRSGTLGAQPITSFSRLEKGIDDDAPTGILDSETAGETFANNISMFDEGNDIRDFATDKANPTPEELRQGFRGTIEHELSHGLIEGLSINGQTMIDEFADQMVFWDTITDRHFTDPTRPNSKVRSRELAIAAGEEAPITHYGATDAFEDLAESLMFYFENPTKLNADCPARFAFIQTNIQPILNGTA